VQGLFEQKKNQGACPDCPCHCPERKRPNADKFTRKKNYKEGDSNAFLSVIKKKLRQKDSDPERRAFFKSSKLSKNHC
jgi:hypothetical protein